MSSSDSSDPQQKLAPRAPTLSPPQPQASQHMQNEQESSFSDIGSFSDIFEQLDDDELSTFTPNAVIAARQQQAESFLTSSNGSMEPAPVSSSAEAGKTGNEMTSIQGNASSFLHTIPNKNDVLLGRGGKNNQHSGNEQLRRLAREMSHSYAAAPKRNKPSIAWLLVTKIRFLNPPGRYVITLFGKGRLLIIKIFLPADLFEC